MSDSPSAHSRLASHVRNMPSSGIREFFDIVSREPDVISLGIGEPDFVTPWHIREGAIFALERGATSYTSNLGLAKLRHAVADYVAKAFGCAYNPDTEILITVGVSEALDLAARALVDPGVNVLYHEPCYVSYAPVIRMAQGIPVPVPTKPETGFQLTRAMLETHRTPDCKILLLNFPTNPTGATLDRKNAEDIAAFACEHDLLVLSDEIYSELTYDGPRVSMAALPGMRERTIFLHGFSKAWAMTGFRIGYACGPADLIEGMTKIHQYTMLCAPILSQEAAVEALKSPDTTIEQMRDAYLKRRNFIHRSLNDMGLLCRLPAGAFYAFPSVKPFGLSAREFAIRLLQEKKVACVPGTAFGAAGKGHIRCSYATEMDELKEAMRRIADFVAELGG